MYERFTDRARKVMALANQEAQRFGHEYIGTEHMLLGLIKEGSGVGANVLKNVGVDLVKIRQEVEQLVQPREGDAVVGKLPQTPLAKNVIKHAIEEARSFNHNYVGTEHVLLGLVREQDGVAAHVLMNLGLKLEVLREEVLNLLGAGMEQSKADVQQQCMWFLINRELVSRLGPAALEAGRNVDELIHEIIEEWLDRRE